IAPINDALKNVFGEENGTKLHLIEIIPPLEGKVTQITFRKGESEIHYNYLSAGEKEVFNLLINLLSRSSLYQDTIYYLDEIDLHLNTKLQYNLLKEITENWVPENCQLWTATHSLGFIEYAKQSDHASILDFDDLNFDLPQVLSPEPKDNPEVYEIAVGKDFLPSLFQHLAVYFVENKDQDYYASAGIPGAVFVAANDRNSVYHKVRTSEFNGIVDRDFLSDEDIEQIRQHYPKLRVLNYYSIENYIYHPDNLAEYYQNNSGEFDKQEYIQQLTEAKNQVKDSLILQIVSSRSSYPYFGEPEFNGKSLQKRFRSSQENFDQASTVQKYLNSDELETFYKSLPVKDYGKHLPQRQHIAKSDLVKTAWFKAQITEAMQ
uniref:chromosome segregation protein SMC n=1 Tax=Persicitalea sp. TaxID=3100273 RepID=UPI003593360E